MSFKHGSKATWLPRVFTAAVLTMSFATVVQATPVTYDFTVQVTSGPLQGTSDSGSFSYGSSSIVPGGYVPGNGLLTALDLTFNGIAYNASTANTGSLSFDAAGNLNGFSIGTSCNGAFGCDLIWGTNGWYAFPGTSGFTYSAPMFSGLGHGNFSFALAPMAVPEPDSIGMFGLGLLLLCGGLGWRMWQRSKDAATPI